MNLPIYVDMKLFVEKEMTITWQEIKGIFLGSFKEDLEDQQVCINIHKSGLYMVGCRYLPFPCMDIIHWIVAHTNPEMMALRSMSGTQLFKF